MKTGNWSKCWALLDARERRMAWIVLVVVIIAALFSAVMIGSIMPFLTVLSDPSKIETVGSLSWAYVQFGFKSNFDFVVALGLTSLVVIVLASLISIAKVYVVARFANMRIYSISNRLLNAYLSQPYAFFLDRHTGEMGTRILSETEQGVKFFLQPAAEFIASSLAVIAIVALLLWVDPLVAAVAFGVLGGLYGLIYVGCRLRLKGFGEVRAVANSSRYRIATEALGGIKDIKLLGREASYLQRYSQQAQRMSRSQMMVQVLSEIPVFALQAVAFGGVILLCLALVDEDGLATGAALGGILPIIGVFAFAVQRLMPELSKMFKSIAMMQAGGAAIEAIYDDLIATGASVVLPQRPPVAMGLHERLELEQIHFSYANAEQAGIRDVSLCINAGEKIGIVGTTGAGKTTLADVILGLLWPTSGRMLIDGTPVTDETLRAWQQTVGYVPQDIFLVDASIAENIALGISPEDIDLSTLHEAARIAQLEGFVLAELSQGYDTIVGERGVRLSGGQRQRIGIARALYHDADLIVFDEATSALDNVTEREVMSAIENLPGDKTVLMIAHRLSTVIRCDRIIVLDKGRLVGCDTWDALMAKNAMFQKLASVSTAA